jgi:UDP-N-acetylmuramoyl-tripeptide--D-alanyl-D-alanine ligase
MSVIERLYNEFVNSSGISIDTRTLKKNEMFFAISGENYDGNVFAQSALDAGASCVVVSDRSIVGPKVICVQNSLVALQELASHHRDKLKIPVVAITGSNGKTTTKELINQVLSKKFQTVATKGNLNNHIGVPLSLLAISDTTEIAVIELGANHIGEIRFLCSLTRPTHGLITNIGKAHLEGFGSLEGVKIAKSELYDSLKGSSGVVFVNMSADYLEELSKNVQHKVKYAIDNGSSDILIDYRFASDASGSGTRVVLQTSDGEKHPVESVLYGAYNVSNIATAVTLGLYFGVEIEDIAYAIKSYHPDNNRSQIVQKEGKTILLDAYNANPVSMELAVSDMAGRNETKCLILGGMNELGDHAHSEHLKLLELVSRFEWGEVLLIGEHFAEMHQSFDFRWFGDVYECQNYLERHLLPDGVILVKGSRSLQMESLLGYIK